MFRLGRVSREELLAVARASCNAEVTYPNLGATLSGSIPPGFRHDRHDRLLSTDAGAFGLAVDGLQRWVPHRSAGLSVEPSEPPNVGLTIALAAPLGPVSAIAVCRVVAVIDEPERFGFAYGTLPGHPECGEEAFVVERTRSGLVFAIVAFSRPTETLARLGGPATRWIQRATTKRYLDGLANFVRPAV